MNDVYLALDSIILAESHLRSGFLYLTQNKKKQNKPLDRQT